jgi:hypothetical protein
MPTGSEASLGSIVYLSVSTGDGTPLVGLLLLKLSMSASLLLLSLDFASLLFDSAGRDPCKLLGGSLFGILL